MEKIEKAENLMHEILSQLDVNASFETSQEEGVITIDVKGDKLNFLIGRRGDVLNSLQHYLSLALFREFDEWCHLVVDINGYRARQLERLEELTKKMIDKVRFFTEDVHFVPMSSFDRKYVHEYVAGYEDIISESEGSGLYRHIVLRLSK